MTNPFKRKYRVRFYPGSHGNWYIAQFKHWLFGWTDCFSTCARFRETVEEAEEDCKKHRSDFCVKEVKFD